MTWYSMDTWIVVVGALAGIACAIPGCFLVLRQMSMMGDAISHAVLPGLALAFIITGSRASIGMFLGAALIGLLTAVFTQWISAWGKVERGASMGIVFTTLFAIGLLLIVQAAHHVDLDPGCVLYGALELTPLDTVIPFFWLGIGWETPRAFVVLGMITLVNFALLLLFYKEFKISSFDPSLATTLGINAQKMHYLLMSMVAVTTVAAFEAVGSILVIALLIVPPATAYLLTDRLGMMLLLSGIFGVLAAAVGHFLAVWLPEVQGLPDMSSAGLVAVASGIFFAAAVLLAPRYGMLGKFLNRRPFKEQKTEGPLSPEQP